MAGSSGAWEWAATVPPGLKNHSNLMKSMGLKVAKDPHLLDLNLRLSSA